MVKLIISKDHTKCRRCERQTFKIQHKNGPDPDRFYLDFDELMCAYCGYIYTGKLSESKKTEMDVKEEDYQKMLENHKKYLTARESMKI